MSENFNGITSQICVSQTNRMTFAAYSGLKMAAIADFMELISGKITLTLRDFSNGRGDKAITAHYNLDIADSEWIFEMSKPQNLREQFEYFGTKIYGNNPIEGGPNNGLCKTFRIHVARRTISQDGTQNFYPWSVSIVNGYARANRGKVAGSFYEAKGSFRPEADLTMRFADLEFFRLLRAIHEAIDRFTLLSSLNLIPAGLQRLEMEQAKRAVKRENGMSPGFGQYAS